MTPNDNKEHVYQRRILTQLVIPWEKCNDYLNTKCKQKENQFVEK